jgi:hypothetical protein
VWCLSFLLMLFLHKMLNFTCFSSFNRGQDGFLCTALSLTPGGLDTPSSEHLQVFLPALLIWPSLHFAGMYCITQKGIWASSSYKLCLWRQSSFIIKNTWSTLKNIQEIKQKSPIIWAPKNKFLQQWNYSRHFFQFVCIYVHRIWLYKSFTYFWSSLLSLFFIMPFCYFLR